MMVACSREQHGLTLPPSGAGAVGTSGEASLAGHGVAGFSACPAIACQLRTVVFEFYFLYLDGGVYRPMRWCFELCGDFADALAFEDAGEAQWGSPLCRGWSGPQPCCRSGRIQLLLLGPARGLSIGVVPATLVLHPWPWAEAGSASPASSCLSWRR